MNLRTKRDSAIENRPVKLRKQPPALTTMRKDRTMATKPIIPTELLRQLIRYEPETGIFWWLPRDPALFATKRQHKAWTTRFLGKQALTQENNGYRRGKILGKTYEAHRIAWQIHHGSPPEHEIDHINGVKDDNRICNLRDVTHAENTRNAAIGVKNKSGVRGVHFRPKSYRRSEGWEVSVYKNNKVTWVGSFKKFEDAVAARKKAEDELGYHKNHGRQRV